MNWHSLTVNEISEKLKTNLSLGITEHEAKKRLAEYGENSLRDKKKKPLLVHFFEQFKDFCVIILLIACAISFATAIIEKSGDYFEPIIILAIVVLNAAIGVYQERRAEKAIDALRKLSAPNAVVIRSGKIIKIPSSQLVPGDIIMLENGDMVPADARLIKTNSLKVQESALTGESEPCGKSADCVFDSECPPADRKNTVFSSTTVMAGNCTAVVTETGMNTQVGKIAHLISSEDSPQTPLQKRLEKIGKALGIGALVICAFIFILGVIRRNGFLDSFMLSVSLAVAAIPEGLPAIVTIVLSLGVQRMAKSNAIIRHLPAVETLGAATVICSDKTGTLTQNKMTVTKICDFTGNLPLNDAHSKKILLHASICSNTRAVKKGKNIAFDGDPTETAILNAAYKNFSDVCEQIKNYQRISEIPFSSETKYMATVNMIDGKEILTVKGAPDIVIEKCGYINSNGNTVRMTAAHKSRIHTMNKSMASEALRVIAVAFKNNDADNDNLVFLGLIGMIDPPRPEASKAVSDCKKAGIIPVMITGDHIDTACAIARNIGILGNNERALSGKELDKLTDSELLDIIRECRVFARVSPEHKVRIVKAFRSKGEIVAMTGDGVNDAPALKAADIGCAMGKGGTDVAKNAADMILTDDNFATIVKAVNQGRGIYDNIKKAVHFLLGTNIGEILAVFSSSLLGLAAPLLPIQLLWINLVTDSLPAMALGTEKTEKDIMHRKPLSPEKGFFADGLWLDITLEGFLIGTLTVLAYLLGLYAFGTHGNTILGRTMAFTVLGLCEIAQSVNLRSSLPLFKTGFFSNKTMNAAVIICTLCQASVVIIPELSELFGVATLNSTQWIVAVFLSLVILIVGEAGKIIHYFFRR